MQSKNTKEKQVSHLCKYKKMQYCSQAHTPAIRVYISSGAKLCFSASQVFNGNR
jgi:hypothetical protein